MECLTRIDIATNAIRNAVGSRCPYNFEDALAMLITEYIDIHGRGDGISSSEEDHLNEYFGKIRHDAHEAMLISPPFEFFSDTPNPLFEKLGLGAKQWMKSPTK